MYHLKCAPPEASACAKVKALAAAAFVSCASEGYGWRKRSSEQTLEATGRHGGASPRTTGTVL